MIIDVKCCCKSEDKVRDIGTGGVKENRELYIKHQLLIMWLIEGTGQVNFEWAMFIGDNRLPSSTLITEYLCFAIYDSDFTSST